MGHEKENILLAIKKVSVKKLALEVKLNFDISNLPKDKNVILHLYLVSDVFFGCDQEKNIEIKVNN